MAADEVLILGATGRTGRGIAQALAAVGVPLALFGRNEERLREAAAGLNQSPRLVTGTLETLEALLAADPPKVVVNTVGPFASTAGAVIDALPADTHYLDLSNEYGSFTEVFARNEQAIERGQVLVPGAGFGVISTESVLLTLIEGRPRPTHVRVDALPSVALEAGRIGEALAGSIVDSLPLGRRQVLGGHLVSRAFDDTPAALVTPDDEHLLSVNFASGDLHTAWRLSEAPNVVAGSSEVPSGAVLRYVLPPFFALSRSDRFRGFARRRLANVKLKDRPAPRPCSWGHASARWADGTETEAWLRVADAMEFTCAAAAEVAQRLLADQGISGAHTPCTLFGTELAESVGGTFILPLP